MKALAKKFARNQRYIRFSITI